MRLASLTVHTTVADYVRLLRFRYQPELVNYRRESDYVQAVPMGQGFIDYPGFLGTLRAHGFNGTVAYEMCSPQRRRSGRARPLRAGIPRVRPAVDEGARSGVALAQPSFA
jgi:sugar phosphate isomerase/epimerase